jgi:threonylcarbamoyladenosine tRNA methylthiotransferase MtaB
MSGTNGGKGFFVFTTGCRANQWDSHVLAGSLERSGFTPVPLEEADLVVINACTLTLRAETDARRFIQRTRRVNPGAKVALAGCHAQVYPERNFGADLVLGQAEKFAAAQYLPERGRFVEKGPRPVVERADLSDGAQRDRTRFFFKIQDGCNRFCTYCVVPYARGRVRSRPLEEVAAVMAALSERGVKEVVLTGIDLAAYRDPSSGKGLADLLSLLDAIKTPPRIRLSSVAPQYLDDAFIARFVASPKVAKSIHIPLQSGSDDVLKAMGRPYDSAFIRHVVDSLRQAAPEAGIGMDVMAGFPGEDERCFGETCALLGSLDVSYLHVFPYSEREGTRAAAFDNKVPQMVKTARVRRLKEIDRSKREAFSRRFIGEGRASSRKGRYNGRLIGAFPTTICPSMSPMRKR